ncbi:MAG: serine/threonine protein kinase [Tannerella sp.]|jgi:serine/threonine-protein kinase|nr:serine/threonine protein kinase [Tannerella sp.]
MHLPKGYYLQNRKYRLTSVIGQGGFGITYLGVWNTEVKGELGTVKTDVPVCIKEYFFKDYCNRNKETMHVEALSHTGKVFFDKFKEKLIREAKILSEVHHPYIVNVLEVFEENNTAYIAMEYISGYSLKYMQEKDRMLPENKVLKYIHQIGQALEFVHQKNILHLDIKPNNILIDKNDNARLIDFGVSKRYDIEQEETITSMLTLSKGFASIEQYDNEGIQSFSPCPDIYSLGATMYNLLTGEIPTESILRATKPLAKPSELNGDISSKTEKVILKAMAINPVERYQSVKQMLSELDVPSYFEDTGNKWTETDALSYMGKNETTEMRTPHHADKKLVGDRSNTTNGKKIKKKKIKRRILVPLLIFFFTFVGYAVTYILDMTASRGTVRDVSPSSINAPETEGIIIKPEENVPVANAEEDTKTENENIASVNAKQTADNKADKTKNDTDAGKEKEQPTTESAKPSEEQINAEYNALIASGKTKMGQQNYAEAKKDFAKAKELKVTEEVVRLSITCDEQEEERKITERKALYVDVMPFGNYVIVKKKSNGRYGLIDAKGNERVKTIYLSVGRSENGRAFEREDHLFDIYNSNGELVGNGLTEY